MDSGVAITGCFYQAKNQPANIIEKPATGSSGNNENIDADESSCYTKFAFTHTEDSANAEEQHERCVRFGKESDAVCDPLRWVCEKMSTGHFRNASLFSFS